MSFYYQYPYYSYQDKPIRTDSFQNLTIKEQHNFVLGRLHCITTKYNLFNTNPYAFKFTYEYIFNRPYASDIDIIECIIFILYKLSIIN